MKKIIIILTYFLIFSCRSAVGVISKTKTFVGQGNSFNYELALDLAKEDAIMNAIKTLISENRFNDNYDKIKQTFLGNRIKSYSLVFDFKVLKSFQYDNGEWLYTIELPIFIDNVYNSLVDLNLISGEKKGVNLIKMIF